MPKRAAKKKMPYLSMAIICESVIEDKSNVLSAIRIIDNLSLKTSGPGAPQDMPFVPWVLTAIVALKAGEARGNYKIELVPHKPDGTALKAAVAEREFTEEWQSLNAVFPMTLMFGEPGMYWFDVLVEGTLVTRIPLSVNYTRELTD